MTNTRDLNKFGYRELEEASRLLKNANEIDAGSGLAIEFNQNSGNVFLVDDDCRCWMMDDDKICEFFWCWECGNEGFMRDFRGQKCKECKRIYKEARDG